MIFLDTETCGLTGPIVLIQYQFNDGPIYLYEVWKMPVRTTINLLEWFMKYDIVGFNLVFDHFHITKLYNLLIKVKDKSLLPLISEIRDIEAHLDPSSLHCLKPHSSLDLFLYARETKYPCPGPPW